MSKHITFLRNGSAPEHTNRKVAYNTIVQIGGRIIGLFIALITVAYVSNHLIVDGSALAGYGQYTIVFTYISILGTIADFGLFTLLVREITGKDKNESGRLIGASLVFRFITGVLLLLIMMAILYFLPYAHVVKDGILIGAVIASSMLFSQTVEAIFQAKLQANKIVIVETVGKIIIAALTIYVLRLGYGLVPIVLVNLIGQLVTFFLSLLLARPLTRIRIKFDLALWKSFSVEFWAIALINFLALVHFKSDTILLTFFKPVVDVGIYGVAYKILEVILIVPSIFATNLLPIFSGLFMEGNLERLGGSVRRASSIIFIIATYIATVVIIFAPWIVVFVTQKAFIDATLPLRILSISLIFSFVTTLLGQAIIAARLQQKMVNGYLLVILINVGLNLFAIPRYSYVGAATTTAITEAILLIYTIIICHKHLGKTVRLNELVRTIIASIVTFGLITYLLHTLIGLPDATSLNRLAIILIVSKGAAACLIIFGVVLAALYGFSWKKIKQLTSET